MIISWTYALIIGTSVYGINKRKSTIDDKSGWHVFIHCFLSIGMEFWFMRTIWNCAISRRGKISYINQFQELGITVQKTSLHNQYNFILFQFRSILLQVLMVDFILSLILDRICAFLFCGGKLRQPKQSC